MKLIPLLLCALLVACSPRTEGTQLGTWTNARTQTQVVITLGTNPGDDWPDTLTITHGGQALVFQGRHDAQKGYFIGPPLPGRPTAFSGAGDIFAVETGPNGRITNNLIMAEGIAPGDSYKRDNK